MLQDREIAIDQFIKITSGGIRIADYDQVQAALIKKYKEVYGSDIDLSNITADGVFVNNLALIINNILQSFKTLYANLDVNTASGVYLESLCRLANITRKTQTQSTAQIRVKALQQTALLDDTIFVDTSGNEWVYDGQNIDLNANETATITVTCTEYGPIEAKAGSINQTLEASYFEVEQLVDAIPGQNEETDSQLRARRAQSTGVAGVTVLESIVGALLDLDGIDDVNIINNNTDDNKTAVDGSTIEAHSIYITIRQSNDSLPDESIGEVIYNKLTPGIATSAFTGSNGTARLYRKQLAPSISWLSNVVNWKKATPIHPTFTVQITPGTYFNNDTIDVIKQKVIEYMNSVRLGALPEKNDILIAATYTNSNFNGVATYVVSNVDISGITSNPNTFFKYDIANATYNSSNHTITFA